MNFPRHLRVRPHHTLCGTALYNYDSTRVRDWVTCPRCRRIILDCHPNKTAEELFRHPQS